MKVAFTFNRRPVVIPWSYALAKQFFTAADLENLRRRQWREVQWDVTLAEDKSWHADNKHPGSCGAVTQSTILYRSGKKIGSKCVCVDCCLFPLHAKAQSDTKKERMKKKASNRQREWEAVYTACVLFYWTVSGGVRGSYTPDSGE